MKLLPFIIKDTLRNPVRTGLTLTAAAIAIFIFTSVLSLHHGMERMIQTSSADDVLVVFDRYQGCPPQSKLPVSHRNQVDEVDGVTETTATLFLLSSCSSATDIISVHGIEPETFRRFQALGIDTAQYETFSQTRSGAIIGEKVAQRYGWEIGQSVSVAELGRITFTVCGIFKAPGNSIENTILVNLDYLQFATEQVGVVTLLYVRMADSTMAASLASTIDGLFSSSSSPTKTTPQQAFISSAISGITGIIEFSKWLGYVALGMILLAVGNSLSMSVRDRTREVAILKTIGFKSPQILLQMISEAVLASAAGGILGALLAWLAVTQSGFHLSVEGFTFTPHITGQLMMTGVGISLLIGVFAGFIPAFRASRMKIITALKEMD